MPLLTFDRLELAYGHHPLLDGASLVVEAGERIGLIGRNGTGKSSLLKIIAGINPPDAGDVWRKPALKLAYVPQEPQFQPGHTVFEAVAEGVGAAQTPAGRLPCRRASRWPRATWTRVRRLRAAVARTGSARCLAAQQPGGGNHAAAGPGRRPRGRHPVRRTEKARGAGARAGHRARVAAARRADQPPRLCGDRMAGKPAQRLQGRAAVHYPRPAFPGQRRQPHCRARSRPVARISGQFQRISGSRKPSSWKSKRCTTASSTNSGNRKKSGSAKACRPGAAATKAGCGDWKPCG